MGIVKEQPGAIILDTLEKKKFPKEKPLAGTMIGHVFVVDNLLHNQHELFDHIADVKNFCNTQLKKWKQHVGNPTHSMQGSKPTNIMLSFEIQDM